MRGATIVICVDSVRCVISIHAPRAGSDCEIAELLAVTKTFQSTLPVRERHALSPTKRHTIAISIHAPRAGSDCTGRNCFEGYLYFNSRPPCGERQFVSIYNHFTRFNSRPRAGSDVGGYPFSLHILNFNSRTPCRERR